MKPKKGQNVSIHSDARWNLYKKVVHNSWFVCISLAFQAVRAPGLFGVLFELTKFVGSRVTLVKTWNHPDTTAAFSGFNRNALMNLSNSNIKKKCSSVLVCPVVQAELQTVIVARTERRELFECSGGDGQVVRADAIFSEGAGRCYIAQTIGSYSWLKDSMKYSKCWDGTFFFFFSSSQPFEWEAARQGFVLLRQTGWRLISRAAVFWWCDWCERDLMGTKHLVIKMNNC